MAQSSLAYCLGGARIVRLGFGFFLKLFFNDVRAGFVCVFARRQWRRESDAIKKATARPAGQMFGDCGALWSLVFFGFKLKMGFGRFRRIIWAME